MIASALYRAVTGCAVRIQSTVLAIAGLAGTQSFGQASLPQPSTPARASTGSIRVDYTGRLFGYYRIEAYEKDNYGPTGPRLPAVTRFLGTNRAGHLLVGMGDNFGPEFGASIQQAFSLGTEKGSDACAPPIEYPDNANSLDRWDNKSDWKKLAPEVLYKSESRLPAAADCDNVAHFLLRAGYAAIVPGREDFLYSGTWLRHIALLLKHTDPTGKDSRPLVDKNYSERPHLRVLSANLRVSVSDKACPLLFQNDLGDPGHACTTSGTTQEMDWLERLDETLKGSDPDNAPVTKSLRRLALQRMDFRRQLLENEASLVNLLLEGHGCSKIDSLMSFSKDSAYDLHTEGELRLGTHQAKPSSLTESLATGKGWTCASHREDLKMIVQALADAITSSTAEPTQPEPEALFPVPIRRAVVDLLLGLVNDEQEDVGYTIAPYTDDVTNTARRALIIGVTGQETLQEVSCANFRVEQDLWDRPLKDLDKSKATCDDRDPKEFPIVVDDPRRATSTALRAAWAEKLSPKGAFDRVIVLAQMPPSEAGELSVHVQEDMEHLYLDPAARPRIDMVISEAQEGHETRHVVLTHRVGEDVPVVSPRDSSGSVPGGFDPVSVLTLNDLANGNQTLENTLPPIPAAPTTGNTAASLLKLQLDPADSPDSKTDLQYLWEGCDQDSQCENAALMQHLLRQLQRSSRADLVLLKRRDFYFGPLGEDYSRYEYCDRWMATFSREQIQRAGSAYKDFKRFCSLHVALDRVLWEGDYTERLMVDGATLTGLMSTAQKQTEQEQTLLARDLHQEWLMTYGIMSSQPKNLANAASGPESFSLPGVQDCKPGGSPPTKNGGGDTQTPYCVNGQSVAPDRAYFVITSDHLAGDQAIYGALKTATGKDPHFVTSTGDFVTTDIAREVTRFRQPSVLPHPKKTRQRVELENQVQEGDATTIELVHQDRALIQVDFTKLVASFTVTKPSLTDAQIGNTLSGVSNSTAQTPHSQELDLETATRSTVGPAYHETNLGMQGDAEFDRKVAGNINNKPETVTDPLNTLSFGAFAQLHVHWRAKGLISPSGIGESTRNLWRTFLVAAPYQRQEQLTGNFLSFSITGNSSAQRTVNLPRTSGFNHRFGFRYEASTFKQSWLPDAGTYAEAGPEYAVQENVLSEVDSGATKCPVMATQSLQTCFKSLTITPTTPFTPRVETLKTGGLYWDVHVQKGWGAKTTVPKSVTLDTKGDFFGLPGKTLPTQTRYAVTTSLALNLAVFGNFSLSPTLSEFDYDNQAANPERSHLHQPTFKIAAKWYFGRDAAVPAWKQFRFIGPASIDQTSQSKSK